MVYQLYNWFTRISFSLAHCVTIYLYKNHIKGTWFSIAIVANKKCSNWILMRTEQEKQKKMKNQKKTNNFA